jgi:arginine decarboxylase
MAALKEAAASGDASATAALATRILQCLQTKSFRQHANDWDIHDDSERALTDLLPPSLGRTESHRPYFEVLIVTGVPATHWANLCAEWRRLRRPLDSFVYEPVFVGSFEDAFCATMLNPDLAAVVINEGFAQKSRHDAPVLRTLTASIEPLGATDSALRLAHTLKRVRPELDLYLMSNRNVEQLAGNPEADVLRRIFYSVEELLELHLAILEGVQDRFETPFFDNPKKYAQRPIGTFRALPIARGKSVFKSDRIPDMGEFYGMNLFLAESSATTGGLDSLLARWRCRASGAVPPSCRRRRQSVDAARRNPDTGGRRATFASGRVWADRGSSSQAGHGAEAACNSVPWTIIPMVVTNVQDYIAAGQFRGGEQLIDV